MAKLEHVHSVIFGPLKIICILMAFCNPEFCFIIVLDCILPCSSTGTKEKKSYIKSKYFFFMLTMSMTYSVHSVFQTVILCSWTIKEITMTL